jgi:predicted Fe-S protein YdhL (DUF1289 family)
MSQSEPKSPCISICALSEDDICQGCFRSADEITDWFMASDEEKRAILERSAKRREESFVVRLS